MRRFFVCFAVLTAMVLMISCGGSDGGDDNERKYCTENVETYECGSYTSNRYYCMTGFPADFYNYNNGLYYYNIEIISCHKGCDKNTGKCIAECTTGQYRCREDHNSAGIEYIIDNCDSNEQWEWSEEYCEYGCAKTLSDSKFDLCATESENDD